MSTHAPQLRFALLTKDPELKSRVRRRDLQDTIKVVDDYSSLEAAMGSEDFTGVIVDEPSSDVLPNLSELNGQLNFSKTFVYAGPLPSWQTLTHIPQIMGTQEDGEPIVDPKDVSLASYVEKKIGDFVRAMNVGSGKNLYPALMRAVERPLIELALRETHGNQINQGPAQFFEDVRVCRPPPFMADVDSHSTDHGYARGWRTNCRPERCEFSELRGKENRGFCACHECGIRQEFVSRLDARGRAAPD